MSSGFGGEQRGQQIAAPLQGRAANTRFAEAAAEQVTKQEVN
jgi:hypothetical protein